MLARRSLALSLVVAAFLTGAAAPAQTPVPSQAAPPVSATATTTVIVVRHAEKATDDPRDPSLSPAGEARAQALAAALRDAGVAAVYSTELKRTWLTADPLAKSAGLTVEKRPMAGGDVPTYARELAKEVLARHAGRTVLIVGHSNTVPEIVAQLGGARPADLAESDFGDIFRVRGDGTVERLRLENR